MEEQLIQLREGVQHVLEDKLSGLYLHGSLAMGCYNPASSDIDLIVTVNAALTDEEKRLLGRCLVQVRRDWPAGAGIELSVIVNDAIADLVCPTPVEFHYSEFHHARYAADDGYLVGGYEDTDLAAQLAVAWERGRTLFGEPLSRRMPAVRRDVILASLLPDVGEAEHGIAENPVYYILNLCRTVCYCRTGMIGSKREGGEWACQSLDVQWKPLIEQALHSYRGVIQQAVVWDDKRLAAFASAMLSEIRAAAGVGKERL